MKSFLFCTFLVVSCNLFAQDSLESAWGIRFGLSNDSVKTIVKKKTSKFPKLNDDGDVFTYEDCTFGGRKAAIIKLLFYKRKFYGIDIYFFPDQDPEILSLFEAVKSDLIDKWWPPQVDVESYKTPYEKGDGHEHTAIKLGYSTIGSIWYFPRENGNQDDSHGTILLTVDSKMWVKLSYRDGIISKLFHREIYKKTKDDF